jgi:hypothetical protein
MLLGWFELLFEKVVIKPLPRLLGRTTSWISFSLNSSTELVMESGTELLSF